MRGGEGEDAYKGEAGQRECSVEDVKEMATCEVQTIFESQQLLRYDYLGICRVKCSPRSLGAQIPGGRGGDCEDRRRMDHVLELSISPSSSLSCLSGLLHFPNLPNSTCTYYILLLSTFHLWIFTAVPVHIINIQIIKIKIVFQYSK